MKSRIFGILLIGVFIFISIPACSQTTSVDKKQPETAEEVVRKLYDLATWESGTLPDWEEMKALFIDETVITLRTNPRALTVVDKQGFIDLWLRDVERSNLKDTGFSEKVIKLKTWIIGEIASVYVLYEGSVPNTNTQKWRGVDCFLLMKKEGSWKILSIANEYVRPGIKIPEELQD